MKQTVSFLVLCSLPLLAGSSYPQSEGPGSGPVARFSFDGNIDDAAGTVGDGTRAGELAFVEGLDGQALSLTPGSSSAPLAVKSNDLLFDRTQDFSVQFWVRTTLDPEKRVVVLSQKEFADNSLASQKQPGWVFYISAGTWAWNMGSGARRITYERDNGKHMPVNDGRWHQLTMTHDSGRSEVRLYYDGQNKAVYNVADAVGFDFTSASSMAIGIM